MNIFKAAKEVISELFEKQVFAEKLGVNAAVSQRMSDAIRLWSDIYENRAPWLSGEVRGKHLAYAVTHEIARLVTLEFSSALDGGKRAELLSPVYGRVITDAPEFVESACALGGIILKPYITADGRIVTSYVRADSFFPTAFDDSGNITGCIFAEKKVSGGRYYTRLEYHDFSKSGYVILNRAFSESNAFDLGRSVSLSDVPEWSGLREETSIISPRPLFSYFRMPGANRIDSGSPLGVSVFADAIDAIKDADRQYARMLWEFEGSELAVFADETVLSVKDGKSSAPKLSKRLYRGFDRPELFEVFSPEIRDKSLLNGLDAILRDVEYLSGLAYGTLSRQAEKAKTATEIKASRQRSYCTVRAIQNSLRKALTDYIEVLGVLCDLYGLAPKEDVNASFGFGDSLVIDSEYERRMMLEEVKAGLLKPEEYLMRSYGVTEGRAKEMMAARD